MREDSDAQFELLGSGSKPLPLFQKHDKDGNGYLSREEFYTMLYSIGATQQLPKSLRVDFAESQFQLADLNGDGWVSLDEFTNYFYAELKLLDGSLFMDSQFYIMVFKKWVQVPTLPAYKTRSKEQNPPNRPNRTPDEKMMRWQFVKLCQDSGFIDDKLCKKSDADVMYSWAQARFMQLGRPFRPLGLRSWACKTGQTGNSACLTCSKCYSGTTFSSSERTCARIVWLQFLEALMLVAERRQMGFHEVVESVVAPHWSRVALTEPRKEPRPFSTNRRSCAFH